MLAKSLLAVCYRLEKHRRHIDRHQRVLLSHIIPRERESFVFMLSCHTHQRSSDIEKHEHFMKTQQYTDEATATHTEGHIQLLLLEE